MIDNKEILEEAHNNLKDAADSLNEWRETASDCYDFYAGDQWEDEDRRIMEDYTRRQTVTFNRVAKIINALSGQEIMNRQETRYFPRTPGKARFSEVMTGAAKWARDEVDAAHEESDAMRDLFICGMGWMDLSIDADQREPMIRFDRVDPLETLWDITARKQNLTDAKWVSKIVLASAKDLEEEWPDIDLGLAAAGSRYLEYHSTPVERDRPRIMDSQSSRLTPGEEEQYELIEYHYYITEIYYQLIAETGRTVDFTVEKFGKVRDYADSRGLRYSKRKRKRYYTAVICGKQVLAHKESISQDGFPLQSLTALRHRNDNTWFGMVQLMLDPQRWANKWLSQMLHITNTNAKGGLLAETNAFASVEQAEDSWARSDSITWMLPGGMDRVREKPLGQVPNGIDRMLNYAMESILDVTGVSPEMLGMVERDQPGVVEEARKRQGITLVAPFFDALKRYYKLSGRILMELIRKYIADGRLIKVVGEEGAQFIPLIRDALEADYSLVVDEAPSSPSVKDRTFAALMQIIPLAVQAGVQVPPDVLDYAPLPESLITKWRETLNPPEPDPEAMRKAKEAEELQKAQAMALVHDLESGAKLKDANAQEVARSSQREEHEFNLKTMETSANMHLQKAKSDSAIALEEQKARSMEMQTILEGQKLNLEAMRTGFELEMKRLQAMQQSEMERMRMEHLVSVEQTKADNEIIRQKMKMCEPYFLPGAEGPMPEGLRKLLTGNSDELMGGFTAMIDAVKVMHKDIKAPRKREIVRDGQGRATHAIERIQDEE